MIPRRLFRAFHGSMVADHLKKLEGRDRYLRFGGMLTDDAIDNYIERSWGTGHVWFGIVEEDAIVALVHVAQEEDNSRAELGLSVNPEWRGQKLGQALFERAVFALKARDVRDVYMHCLSENAVMKHIARKNSMVLETEYGEVDADLQLPPATIADVGVNLMVEQLAIYDNAMRNTTNALKHYTGF